MLRVLVCGSSSFAAQGLVEYLASHGCEVDHFNRRSFASPGATRSFSGDPCSISDVISPEFNYDAVINYLLIKNQGESENVRYLDALLGFCRNRGIKRLVHLSSVSVYPSETRLINESAPIEAEPQKKGSYGSIKVAGDNYLLSHPVEGLQLVLLRPGFILGDGLADPIVGSAYRTPFDKLFIVGAKNNVMPITTRGLVHDVVLKVVSESFRVNDTEIFLLADKKSPTKKEFVDFLCYEAGYGRGSFSIPGWFWRMSGSAVDGLMRLIGKKIQIGRSLKNAGYAQAYDPQVSEQKLRMDFTVDWKRELLSSLEGQTSNWTPLAIPPEQEANIQSIGYLGWGRIVQQKHLPALKKLGISPKIRAYDLFERKTATGQRILDVQRNELEAADLYVVSTPGPAHDDALHKLQSLRCPILVEKPLTYSREGLGQWTSFAAQRESAVSVCHNYRFKSNVAEFERLIREINPGKLLHCDVWFQSPPVANESAQWLRNERESRTLLYDYGLHFLDLACMFSRSPWSIKHCRYDLNGQGQTSLIEGVATSDVYSVSFLLRQGAMPRRCRIRYIFQNYDATLDFFPDVFSSSMSNASPYLLRKKASRTSTAIRKKVFDKLLGGDRDESHAFAIKDAISAKPQLQVSNLQDFYRFLFELGDAVYG